MMMTASTRPALLALVTVAALAITFHAGLEQLALVEWRLPEYQHAALVPFVSLYLLWARARDLRGMSPEWSWVGVVFVAAGLLAYALGELGAGRVVIWYAFVLTLWGIALTVLGLRAAAVLWVGLAYLAFMVPLPQVLLEGLSSAFQLWSSRAGTAFLRLVGASVYLEGNVIDFGSFRLQIIEACSGLRYLFPLLAFACFCAATYRGRPWEKATIILSTIPVTIVMNGFRIAVTGLLVNYFGTGQAEGFLHYFEGWVTFVACIALVCAGMALLARRSGRRLAEAFEIEIPALRDFRYLVPRGPRHGAATAAAVLVVVGAAGSLALQGRTEYVPTHRPLAEFPRVIGEWSGSGGRLGVEALGVLQVSDHVVGSYRRPADPMPVDLYVGYYGSQRGRTASLAPRACLPPGGWHIREHEQIALPGLRADGSDLVVNRVVAGQEGSTALVYYWFVQRGRYLTSQYAVDFYNVRDAIMMNRTDGALIRVMTAVTEPGKPGEADRRLTAFLRAATPRLRDHIPQVSPVLPAQAHAPRRASDRTANTGE